MEVEDLMGCFSRNGVDRLHKGSVNFDKDHYIRIVKYCSVPSVRHLFGEGEAIFQQDNAPCHTANLVKQWFNDNNVHLLSWPGNSPDINPVAHIWDYIERKIEYVVFKNTTGQKELEWNSIPMNY